MNSEHFSCQRRRRLYWTNIPLRSNNYEPLKMAPKMESILLPMKDCYQLELSNKAKLYMNRVVKGGRHKWQFGFHSDMKRNKSATVTAAWHKGK